MPDVEPLIVQSSFLHSTFRLGVAKWFSLKIWQRDIGCKDWKSSDRETSCEGSGNDHHPLLQACPSHGGLAKFRGRVRMVPYFHLSLFQQKSNSEP